MYCDIQLSIIICSVASFARMTKEHQPSRLFIKFIFFSRLSSQAGVPVSMAVLTTNVQEGAKLG